MPKIKSNDYQIETSKKSARKYPNVIWFPRSKTDPREIREVLKVALIAQKENPENYFNDKILGVKMARIGSINVIGLGGDEYIESYQGKSIGDVSYITNARMLMRLFRFLGLVTRESKGKYVVTDLGELYCKFNGDFPNFAEGLFEEKVLLDSLANFSFYCVNDDATFRDSKFRVRPFYWLLHTLTLEPQCIYQLIITAFASQSEGVKEVKRIQSILDNLRKGKTNLKAEWEKAGLDPDDYSCVHNFYDSAKILVYLGVSLGLIEKVSDPVYGKKISGNAKNLKQATIFYRPTEKGKNFVSINSVNKLVYYDELFNIFGNEMIIESSLLLASLNFQLGNKKVSSVSKYFFEDFKNLDKILKIFKSELGIDIRQDDLNLYLDTPISFSFYQSIPPEILHLEQFQNFYKKFIINFVNTNNIQLTNQDHSPTSENKNYKPYFELKNGIHYQPSASVKTSDIESAVKYGGKDNVFGGSDRFSSRVSPTGSVVIENGVLLVDNSVDALDLLIPLKLNDKSIASFIEDNTLELVNTFLKKSDSWEKDQHYTWVRNCFRHFGMDATYSGSGGMLSRADVSILSPMISGIEAKSPRENRGTLNLKAIRQAVEAKMQVMEKIENAESMPASAIAIGRRVSTLAINAEKSWSKQGQPVLLITDAILYYLVIKSASLNYKLDTVIDLFTKNHGQITKETILNFFKLNTKDNNYLEKVKKEIDALDEHFKVED